MCEPLVRPYQMSRARRPTNGQCSLSGIDPQAQLPAPGCTFGTHLLAEVPAAEVVPVEVAKVLAEVAEAEVAQVPVAEVVQVEVAKVLAEVAEV